MDTIEKIIDNVWVQRLFWSCITILVSTIIYFVISKIIEKKEKRNSRIFDNKKNKTYLKMLRSITGYVLLVITALFILQIFGVDTSSMLAGVGIISLVIGFAIQDALKDIIKGFDIISDNYYRVGDCIKYNNIEYGKVLSVGLKTTKIEDIMTGNIVSIANRNIDQVEVVSGDIYLTIPIPYDVPVEKAEKILGSTIATIKKDENVKEAKLLGLNKLNESSMDYLFAINCPSTVKLPTRRKALHIIVTTLEKNKISIPYPQLDIHTKK